MVVSWWIVAFLHCDTYKVAVVISVCTLDVDDSLMLQYHASAVPTLH